MKKNRKKANVIILFLISFLGMAIVAAIFLNIAFSTSVVNRIMFGTGEAARLRAQSVDIRLKEQEGLVEMYHYKYEALEDELLDIDHESISMKNGHKEILKPATEEYNKRVKEADEAAIKAAIDAIEIGTGRNVDGENIMNPQPENFCIDVKPIPVNGGIINFSCSVTLNGENIDFVYDYVVAKEQAHTFGELNVKNAVMVGAAIEYQNFIHRGLMNLGLEINPHFTHLEVAFPEVDVCTRAVNDTVNNPAICNSALKNYILN